MTETKKPAAKDVNASLALGGADAGVSGKDAFEILKNAKDSDLEEITGEYLTFDKIGETKHFLFTAMTTVTIDGKTNEAVELVDENNNKFVYAGAIVVNTLKKLTQVPCYVRLTYKGEEKSKVGTYKVISVKTFPGMKA